MNYSGKFDAKLAADGVSLDSNGHPHAHVETITQHATHVPAGAIIVPDAHLLFNGDFKRSGVDLVLSKDSQELVLHDYFKGEKRAALSSPDGAHLTGDLVNALTGHVDYAQADGSASVGKVIGHVTKLVGTATAVRNGVSITLNNGDNVEKGDVVSSGSDSTVGITFIDGTVFGLSSNARMVLNEMVYDPNGSNNSSLLSLVAGTITFVAGETAKHGDMKVDTPVATMGIRGTAVLAELPSLIEIDFNVPSQGGVPAAKFQVLVEPDGTTGSYILFDKQTLMPLVTIDTAGKYVAFANGQMSTGNALFSPEVQKLITDVFAQKFTDNTNQTTKSASSSIGSSTADTQLTKTAAATDQSTHTDSTNNNGAANKPDAKSASVSDPNSHIPGPPTVAVLKFAGAQITELVSKTGDGTDKDAASGSIGFNDINVGDNPTATVTIDQNAFTFKDAHGNDITPAVHSNAQWLADVKAVEVDLVLVPDPGNKNVGSVNWTYSVPDGAFDFLAAGETLTLTYVAHVNNDFAPLLGQEITSVPFTIVITGTNDTPVITTDQQVQHIAFTAGTSTTGGPLISGNATSGTFAFTDTDLTDTHTVATALTGATMSGPGAPTLHLQQLEALAPGPFAIFEQALLASIIEPTNDSTGTGAGTINWQLVNLPVFLADFIPKGETLTLDYTVTVTDSQGATDTKTVEVTITGADANAEVWIRTTTAGVPNTPDGLWTDGQNWETGRAPVAADDVIIITDQLHALKPGDPDPIPSYPVTIDATTQAAANSVTMDDFSTTPPELDILAGGSLTIGTFFTLNADSILHNSGTLTVGGKMELLDRQGVPAQLNQSVVVNSGTIKLGQGGDFDGLSQITNAGTIEIQGGSLNILVDLANTDGVKPGQITVDLGATLALGTDPNNSPSITGGITGGTVIINGTLELQGNNFLKNGTLVNSGQIKVSNIGNALDGETVTNTGGIEVLAGGALLIDPTTIDNTGGSITVDAASLPLGAATLTLNQATITGGIVTDNGTLDLTGTAVIKSGTLGNTGQIKVSNGGNALDGETVTNTGGIEVLAGGALLVDLVSTVANTGGSITVDSTGTLTLNGATITGGIVTDSGAIHVTGDSAINTAALNNGQLTVDLGKTLTLDGTTVTGTTITDNGTVKVDATKQLNLSGVTLTGGAINNLGTVDITGDTTINNDALANTQLTVDATRTLTLNGTTITGGIVTDSGALDLTGTAVLKNGTLVNSGQIKVSNIGNALDGETVTNTGGIEVLAGGALLIDPTTIDNTGGSITVDAASLPLGAATLTLNQATITAGTVTDNGTIDLTGTAVLKNGTLGNTGQINVSNIGNALDHETVTNTGNIDVSGALLVDLVSTVANTGGSITVDGTGTLTLNGATITGGIVTDSGAIHVTGDSAINTAALTGGQVTVDATKTLTLDNTTVTGTTITDNGTVKVDAANQLNLSGVTLTGGAINNSGTVDITGDTTINNDALANAQLTVDATRTLTLNGTTITAGTVTDSGAIDLTGTAVLKNGTLVNSGQIKVSNIGNALDGETVTNTGGIEVLAGGALLIDPTTIDNTGGSITVDAASLPLGAATLTLNQATITGGTVTDNGTLDLTGTAVIKSGTLGNTGQINVSGTGNSLDGETVTVNTGTIDVLAGALLVDLVSTIDNSGGTVTVDGTGTLTLNGATITGGIVTDSGAIHVTGDSAINTAALTGGQVTVDATRTLTLDNTTVTGTTITDNGTVKVDAANQLNLSGVTLTGGAIDNLGTVDITGDTTINNDALANTQLTVDATRTLTLNGTTVTGGTVTDSGTLDLTGTAVLKNGTLVNSGQIKVSNIGNALDGETVTNTGGIEVLAGGALLIDPTTIDNTGGSITVDAASLPLGAATLTLNQATITGGIVTDNGTLDLTGTAVLKNGTLGNTGQINVSGTGNALDGETITNTGNIDVSGALLVDLVSTIANTGGSITVDGTGTLTLNGTTVTGGTVTDSGAIHVTGDSAIDTAALNGGQVTVDATRTLTLDNTTVTGSTITDNGTVKVDALDTLNLSGVTLTGGALDNLGTVDIIGDTTINSDTLANTQLTVDATRTLTLNGTTVTGGTVTDSGTLDLTGTAVLKNGTLVNSGQIKVSNIGNALDGETVTNTGGIEVLAGGALLIDPTTIDNTGGSITVDAASLPLGAATLTLNGATVTGGIVTDNGTLDLTGTAVLKNGTLGNTGQINVSGTGNALDGETITNTGNIDVSGALLVDLVSTIANTGGSITVDGTGTLTLNGTTVTGGTVTDSGTLDLTGTAVLKNGTLVNSGQIKVSGTGNALDGETVTNTGGIEVLAGGALLVDQVSTVDNTGGGITVDGTGTVTLNGTTITGGNVTDDGTLNLQGSSVKNGTLVNDGTLNSTGISAITDDGITNTGLIEVTGGVLTIDPAVLVTLVNSGTLEANGGELDITGEPVANSGTLQAIDNSTLKLTSITVTNTSAGTVTVDSGSTLDLIGAVISGGKVIDSGTIDVSGKGNSLQNVTLTNTGTLEITSGAALKIAGSILGGGSIKIDPGAFLELDASVTSDQNIVFNGTSAELQIDGSSMGGKIAGLVATDQLDLRTIGYGLATTATYVGGVLHVTDGHGDSIDLTLVGDYSHAHFAGGTDGNNGTLITLNALDDKPMIPVTDLAQTATLTEVAGQTGVTTLDASIPASGAIHFTDIDLTDRPTAGVTFTVTYFAADGTTPLTLKPDQLTAIENGFKISPESGNNNNGAIDWSYRVADNALDFLPVGAKVTLVSMVTIDDGQGGQAATPVTITITGTDDAPVAHADTVQAVPAGWSFDAANGHYYRYVPESQITWNAANAAAVAAGGYLATITDASENTFVHNLVGAHNAWLGGSDAALEGTWAWVTGPESGTVFYINSPQSFPGYSNWNNGEPNNLDHGTFPHDEDYLQMLSTGKWNDEQGPTVPSSDQTDGYVEEMGTAGVVLANFVENKSTSIATAALLANDTDVDDTTLVVSAVNATSAAHGTLTLSGGVITYTPSANFSGTDQFSYTISDGHVGGTATGTLSFTVAAVNQAPVAATPTTHYSVTAKSNLTLQGTGLSVSDIDGGNGVETATLSVGEGILTVSPGGSGVIAVGGNTHSVTLTGTTAQIDLLLSGNTGNLGYIDNFSNPSASTTLTLTINDNGNTGAGGALSDSASSTIDIIPVKHPAGIAGEPINLGLASASETVGAIVTVAIADIPSGWAVDGGTLLNDGIWTVQTSDPGSLTITSPVDFTGAMLFNITETWTQADGSTATVTVGDNVEAYSVGSPIFALSGDDFLTASSGKDLLVFSQPIGHDTVYGFAASQDQIDLVGYAGLTSFTDVQTHMTEDAAGNTVITLGDGQSITLEGVHEAALTEANFEFNQTPVLNNAGTMTISDGAIMPLSGAIDNTGAIELLSASGETDLQLIEHGVTLTGAGHVVLSDSAENVIGGTSADVTLTNVDNTISGAGQIGAGQLTLINQGMIDATGTNSLIIDTGVNAVINSGTLEATGRGGLIIQSDVANTGILWANGGNVTLEGNVSGNGSALISGSATFEFAAASAENTAFAPGSTGTLVLDHGFDFAGIVSGVTASNHLDLLDFSFANGVAVNYTANAQDNGGTLSVTDGEHTANIALSGHFDPAGFQTGVDRGTGTLISYHDAFHLA